MITPESGKQYSDEDILEVKQITGKGEVNDIYILTTTSSKEVLRIDPSETSLDRFQKEAWCMNETQKFGVLGPKVLKVGMKDGHPFMVMSYVDGTDGNETQQNEQETIWKVLGEYARSIHAVKVTGYGEKMVTDGIFEGSWYRFIDYNISSLSESDKLIECGIIMSQQSKTLRDIFLKLKSTPFTFGLIHNDLSLKNTRINPDGSVYLLDWGSAEVSVVPHMDIAEILHSSLDENSKEFELFLQHYGLGKEEFEEMKPDILNLRLLLCTDKLRWAIDQRPDLIDEKTKEFKNAFERLRI